MNEIEKHIKQRRLAVSASIRRKKKIYLDTNYWIQLQNEARQTDNSKRTFLNKAIELFQSGNYIFPISEANYLEILKQSDQSTLQETLDLAELLSSGIAIIQKEAIIQLEVSYFMQSIMGNNIMHSIDELVWDRIILKEIPRSQPLMYKDNVDMLNLGKLENNHKGFLEVFRDEVVGYVDLYSNFIKHEMCYLLYRDKGIYLSPTELNDIDVAHVIHKIVEHILKGQKPCMLSSLHIIPQLFAIHRNNKDQKHKDGNDTMDFAHASFALPFCDFFFTERGLKSLVIQGKLNEAYSCIVESNKEKVLEVLNSLS